MKSIAIILGLLFCGISLTAFSQTSMNTDDYPPYPNLGSQFQRQTLTLSERQAFEQRAVQKLRDLADYIGLAGSASYDGQLRKQAGGMAVDLFLNESQTFVMFLPDCRAPGMGPIGEYLRLLAASKQYETLVTKVGQISLLAPGMETEEGTYAGRLGFVMNVDFRNNEISKCDRSFTGEIDFILLRVKKKFGNKEKLVWETKLGGVH
jgi:hypothetical protein